MNRKAIEKIVKVSGAVVRTVVGIGAAALVFLGILSKKKK